MDDKEYLYKGWDFAERIIGAELGARRASFDAMQNDVINTKNIKIQELNAAIDELAYRINNHPKINCGVEQFKGSVAEEMQAGTFNINAIKADSPHRAWTLQENGYASVDVQTNFGENYSLKYSNIAGDAEQMQAELNTNTRMPKYYGQKLLIAPEQLSEARKWAIKREAKNRLNRPEVADAHRYVKENLVGKISDDEGVSSDDLSVKDVRRIAKEAKSGGYNPEKDGYRKEVLIDELEINYINQALNAGLTAAAITVMMQLVPELYKAVDYLIKNGEIDLNAAKKSGERIITASGEAFLRGSAAYCVELAAKNGLLGEALRDVNPSVIGVAVTIILGTVKDSILVAAGKMSPEQMGMHLVDNVVISAGYLASMKLGGAIAQVLFPEVPVMSYVIGSLLGCSVAVVYNIGKNKLISFCVDTGFTCFGLVEQDYQLPEEVLRNMGIELAELEYAPIEMAELETANIQDDLDLDLASIETVEIQILQRGFIGVNKVGFRVLG